MTVQGSHFSLYSGFDDFSPEIDETVWSANRRGLPFVRDSNRPDCWVARAKRGGKVDHVENADGDARSVGGNGGDLRVRSAPRHHGSEAADRFRSRVGCGL